jgi:hypothetical protein
MSKHKIYCFNNGGEPGFLHGVAIGDDGVVVSEHICTNESFIRYDLGLQSTRKHEDYDRHFGEGNWELEWVADVHNHTGLKEAIRLNALLGEAASSEVPA